MASIEQSLEPIAYYPRAFLYPLGDANPIPFYSSIPLTPPSNGKECLPCVVCGLKPNERLDFLAAIVAQAGLTPLLPTTTDKLGVGSNPPNVPPPNPPPPPPTPTCGANLFAGLSNPSPDGGSSYGALDLTAALALPAPDTGTPRQVWRIVTDAPYYTVYAPYQTAFGNTDPNQWFSVDPITKQLMIDLPLASSGTAYFNGTQLLSQYTYADGIYIQIGCVAPDNSIIWPFMPSLSGEGP